MASLILSCREGVRLFPFFNFILMKLTFMEKKDVENLKEQLKIFFKSEGIKPYILVKKNEINVYFYSKEIKVESYKLLITFACYGIFVANNLKPKTIQIVPTKLKADKKRTDHYVLKAVIQ